MKKITPHFKALFICSALFAAPSFLNAQYKWDIGISTGAANYLGDMGGNALTRRDFVSDMKLTQTRATVGGFVRYKIMHDVYVQGNLGWARIAGDDKLSSNPARNTRNLNFRNDLVELTGQLQYVFYEVNDLGHTYRNRNNFRAFVGLGAGAAYHNPKANLNGEWIALRPLMTEGKKYTKVTAVVPLSTGFYFTLNKNFRIGWNLTWRTTFTDYLDDVSTRYADPSTLPSALAVQLANRTNELDNVSHAFAENFTPGNKRGDPTHNDSYLTSTVDMSYVIRGHSALSPHYAWVGDRQRHADKYNGLQKRVPLLIRKKRFRW